VNGAASSYHHHHHHAQHYSAAQHQQQPLARSSSVTNGPQTSVRGAPAIDRDLGSGAASNVNHRSYWP
jgi:hypothetical protein